MKLRGDYRIVGLLALSLAFVPGCSLTTGSVSKKAEVVEPISLSLGLPKWASRRRSHQIYYLCIVDPCKRPAWLISGAERMQEPLRNALRAGDPGNFSEALNPYLADFAKRGGLVADIHAQTDFVPFDHADKSGYVALVTFGDIKQPGHAYVWVAPVDNRLYRLISIAQSVGRARENLQEAIATLTLPAPEEKNQELKQELKPTGTPASEAPDPATAPNRAIAKKTSEPLTGPVDAR